MDFLDLGSQQELARRVRFGHREGSCHQNVHPTSCVSAFVVGVRDGPEHVETSNPEAIQAASPCGSDTAVRMSDNHTISGRESCVCAVTCAPKPPCHSRPTTRLRCHVHTTAFSSLFPNLPTMRVDAKKSVCQRNNPFGTKN